MNIIDLFCGTGGFSTGFEATGEFQVTAGLDILEPCVKTFKANHHLAHVIEGDIQKWAPEAFSKATETEPGEVEVVIGSPPCQSFASSRPFGSLTFENPSNTLFESFAFFVQFYQPQFFVLENVVGVIAHNQGRTLQQMMDIFETLGYRTDWRIMNAVHYGLPQRRERLIMIGRRGLANPVRFPEPTHFFAGQGMILLNHPKAIRTYPLMDNQLPPAITVMEAIHDLPELNAGEFIEHYRTDVVPTAFEQARRKNAQKLTLHKCTAHSPKMLEIIKQSGSNFFALPPGLVKGGFSTSYSRIEPNEPLVTLAVHFVYPDSGRCIHPEQDRTLTPREGARFQGFDDDYLFIGNRSQIVKQIGNGVPPLLGQAIATALLEQW